MYVAHMGHCVSPIMLHMMCVTLDFCCPAGPEIDDNKAAPSSGNHCVCEKQHAIQRDTA